MFYVLFSCAENYKFTCKDPDPAADAPEDGQSSNLHCMVFVWLLDSHCLMYTKYLCLHKCTSCYCCYCCYRLNPSFQFVLLYSLSLSLAVVSRLSLSISVCLSVSSISLSPWFTGLTGAVGIQMVKRALKLEHAREFREARDLYMQAVDRSVRNIFVMEDRVRKCESTHAHTHTRLHAHTHTRILACVCT